MSSKQQPDRGKRGKFGPSTTSESRTASYNDFSRPSYSQAVSGVKDTNPWSLVNYSQNNPQISNSQSIQVQRRVNFLQHELINSETVKLLRTQVFNLWESGALLLDGQRSVKQEMRKKIVLQNTDLLNLSKYVFC